MSDFLIVLLYGVMQGGLYCLVGLGLTYTFGVTHILNFAHGELVTIGAFVAVLASPKWGAYVGVGLAVLVVAAISAVLYLGAFRFTIGNHLQGLAVSLGILLVIQNFMIREYSTIPRRGPGIEGYVEILGTRVAVARLIVLAMVVIIVGFFALVVKKSWIGLALRACGDDEFAASTLGMSAKKLGFYAFVVAGILAAAAGVGIGSIYPVTPEMGVEFLLKGFVVVVIGGLGSASGAAFAGVALGVLEALGARYINPSLTSAYAFGFMIIVLMIAPDGLFNRQVRRAG
jgi:branched-chain amino acid transport system permease protein